MSEFRAAADQVRLDAAPRQRWGATAGGLAIVIGLSILDASWGKDFPTAVVIGPFFTALVATERQTAAVAAAAVASVLLSATWNDTAIGADYLLRATVVLAGGAIAVVAARRRARAAQAEAIGTQLTAALSNLAEAVVVQDDRHRLLYANEAAAETLGYASAEVLLTTPREQLVADADYFTEDGSPLGESEYPTARVLRGEDPGPVTIRIVNRSTGEERWRVTKARGVNDSRGRPRLVVSVIEDITERKRSELTQRLLARTGEVLASSVDYEQTLKEVAGLAVPELADWCGVSMPDRQGVIRQVAVAHSDPAKVEFARDFGRRYPTHMSDETGSAQVLRDAQPQLIPEIPDELIEQAVEDPEQLELIRSLGMRSAVMAPMVAASGPPTGVISFVNAESGRAFTEADLELLVEIARRAGIAVENARLYEERSTIARTLQRALLPPGAARHPRLRAGHALPAGGTGELGRRGLLRRVRGQRRLDGRGRRRRRPRRPRGVADRVQPPRAAYRRPAARRSARRRPVPQPPALRAARPGALHALLRAVARARPRRRGDGHLRGASAAARDPPQRGPRAGRALGHGAGRLDGRGVPAGDHHARRR